jgi:heterodisulfide reductase subunit C
MKKINYAFREKLNKELGAFSYNFCYQCGACVADCPTHRYMEAFNPRTIILQALYGFEEELIGPDSLIWNCTNCYNCYERCPQQVNPIEVILALKNMAFRKGTNPPVINNILDRVKKKGVTVTKTDLIAKRRALLGLRDVKETCTDEIKKLMEIK